MPPRPSGYSLRSSSRSLIWRKAFQRREVLLTLRTAIDKGVSLDDQRLQAVARAELAATARQSRFLPGVRRDRGGRRGLCVRSGSVRPGRGAALVHRDLRRDPSRRAARPLVPVRSASETRWHRARLTNARSRHLDDTVSEAGLIALARRGDDSAFDELVRRRQTSIRGLLRRWSGDSHLADDLAQETFVRAWKHLDAVGVAGRVRRLVAADRAQRLARGCTPTQSADGRVAQRRRGGRPRNVGRRTHDRFGARVGGPPAGRTPLHRARDSPKA